MDADQFTAAVRRRLPANFGATADNCIWAVFQTLHERIGPNQAQQLETHLPEVLKKDWHLATTPAERFPHSDETEFLEAVRKRAGLQTLEQAREATLVVFHALKETIPAGDVQDTADELPPDLRDLWETRAF